MALDEDDHQQNKDTGLDLNISYRYQNIDHPPGRLILQDPNSMRSPQLLIVSTYVWPPDKTLSGSYKT